MQNTTAASHTDTISNTRNLSKTQRAVQYRDIIIHLHTSSDVEKTTTPPTPVIRTLQEAARTWVQQKDNTKIVQ